MTTKKYFTTEEIISDLLETLEVGYNGYYCELHDSIFNSAYYIIGTYESKQALESYSVFKAFDEIQEYESNNFEEPLTNLSEPEKMASMLYYILSDNFMNEELSDIIGNEWNDLANDKTNQLLIKHLKGLQENE